MARWFVFAGVIPKADWNHKPQSNGCGSLGIEVVKLFDYFEYIYLYFIYIFIFSNIYIYISYLINDLTWFISAVKINQEYLPLVEMTKCCDQHDICYDTCNSDKEKCDLEFKRCLYKYCDGYQSSGITIVNTCKAAAKMLFTGTTALGCKSYMDAQKEACYCGDKWSKNKKPKRAAQAGGEL